MNRVVVCQYTNIINSHGFWNHNLLQCTTSILLLQTVVIFLCTRTIYILLQPFHQTTIMAQLIGGIIIGPSFLGHTTFYQRLFPLRSRYILKTWAEFGLVLHMFVLGVQIDMTLVKQLRRRAVIIGLSGYMFPLIFGMAALYIVQQNTHLDVDSAIGLPASVAGNAMSSLIVITSVLKELKLINSELGRLASSVAMVCDMFSFASNMVVLGFNEAKTDSAIKPLYVFSGIIVYFIIMFFLLRPLTIWIVSQNADGESMRPSQFISIICIVMGLSFVGNCVSQDAAMCAFFFGLSLPDGPPLGSQLVQKLDFLTSTFVIPIYCSISGIKMELYLLKESSTQKMAIINLIAYFGKFAGVILPSLCFRLSFLKALCLALIICCRGIAELGVYCRWIDNKLISAQIYAILIVNMVIVTGICSIIVGYLYDPSRRYRLDARRAIFKSKQNNLRILVCINKDENVNPIISLLEISNPTRYSPITAYVVQLIELKGSVTAFLKPYHQEKNPLVASSMHIINALNKFQLWYHGNVVVQHFTTITPYASMHDDVCTLALDKRAAIIILPFHRQWGSNNTVDTTSNPSIRALNKNVMGKAPCSVGILVYRGQMMSNYSMLTSKSLFNIVMLFIGGADDREALAYSRRMVEHAHISLTLVCFKTYDSNHKEVDDADLDNQMMSKILEDTMVGKKIIYKEEFVKDGMETIQVIQTLIESTIDLFVIGKNHDSNSQVTLGLTEWLEYPELGIIGDTLVTSNDKFSVLVIQQQEEAVEPS